MTGVMDFWCRVQVACLRRGGVSGSLKPEARMPEHLFWIRRHLPFSRRSPTNSQSFPSPYPVLLVSVL